MRKSLEKKNLLVTLGDAPGGLTLPGDKQEGGLALLGEGPVVVTRVASAIDGAWLEVAGFEVMDCWALMSRGDIFGLLRSSNSLAAASA